jgi:hypothetical protein
MVRIEVAEAEAWVRAGCPTANDGWFWPPEPPVDDPAPQTDPEVDADPEEEPRPSARPKFLKPHVTAN